MEQNQDHSPDNASGDDVTLPSDLFDALEKVSPEQRSVIIHMFTQAVRKESFSGPLPHPDILRGYEEVQKGVAERIVRMAEQEQEHQIRCDEKLIRNSSVQSARGQYIGFAVAVLFLIATVLLGLTGHDWLAGVVGGGTLVAVVTVFLTNKGQRSLE